MRRATKWLAFLVIMAMVTVFIMTSAVTAMAWSWDWWRPPAEEETTPETTPAEVETPAPTETAPAEAETPATTETEPAADDGTTIGKVDAIIWDDTIIADGIYSIEELVDGIMVELSSENSDGTWTLISRQTTGVGSFTPPIIYEHGWVGWDNLPILPWGVTRYKLDLVYDDTYKPLNGGERIAELTPWNNYWQFFYPMADNDEWTAPQIQSTTAAISGYVYGDANADQERQWAEPAYEGWKVVLTDTRGRVVATTTTDQYGYYYFRGLRSGTYKVWQDKERGFKQVAPYHKIFTREPRGCEEGYHKVRASGGNYYFHNDFGSLDMSGFWAPLYYILWLFGNLQYQF